MSQAYFYPSPSLSLSAIGGNGAPIPTNSLLIAGENPSLNLQPLQTDASGRLLVSIAAQPATPLATKDAADGTTGSAVPGTAIYVGLNLAGNLVGLTGTSNGLKVDVQASALPTGAATAANQATANTALARLSGSLVPTAYDEIDLTYVPSGNGVGQIATAVYKLATVTVKTLTMTYDSSNRLSTTVAT